jgi:hypothetical protein
MLAGRAWSGRGTGTPHEEVCLGEEARDGGVTMRCGDGAPCAWSHRVDCTPAAEHPCRNNCQSTLRSSKPVAISDSGGAFTFAFAPRSAPRWSACHMSFAVCAFAFALAFRTPLRPEVLCTSYAAFAFLSAAAALELCIPYAACAFAVPCNRACN